MCQKKMDMSKEMEMEIATIENIRKKENSEIKLALSKQF